MAVDEQNELPKATKREAELQKQLIDLPSRVTELHRTREEGEPRALLRSPELKGEAQQTLQATGAERQNAQPTRIGETEPPK